MVMRYRRPPGGGSGGAIAPPDRNDVFLFSFFLFFPQALLKGSQNHTGEHTCFRLGKFQISGLGCSNMLKCVLERVLGRVLERVSGRLLKKKTKKMKRTKIIKKKT